LTTEVPVTWEFAPVLDAGHRAALSGGKPLVYVCPPAGWAIRPLFAAVPHAGGSAPTVIVVPETPVALDVAGALHSLPAAGLIHPVTGLARSERLLRAARIGTLIATLGDTLELVRRSALKLESVTLLALTWPEECLASGMGEALDTLLAEAQAAQRLVITSDETRIADLLERHARRAPVVWAARVPEAPLRGARFSVVERSRRPWAVRAVLDVLNPERAVLWDPQGGAATPWTDMTMSSDVELYGPGAATADVAIAVDLPSADALAALGAVATQVVVLLDAPQLAYLARIAAPLDAVRLPNAGDRARDWLFTQRREVSERLATGPPLAELLALAPLFEEHDPALVAAALLSGRVHDGEAAREAVATWVRVHVGAGRRERLRTGDLVGVLLNAVGLAKEDVGRIEMHDGFALVDVRATEAERAVRGLNGATIRGRRVVARLDQR
jgi:hypothetical protein